MTVWLSSALGGDSSGSADAGERVQLPEVGLVFCDWLDVTFSPAEDLAWLAPLITSAGGLLEDSGRYTFSQGGTIKHQIGKRWQRLSLSGASLGVFRHYGLFGDLLRSVSLHPHKVTRLDAAYDLAVDAAPIVMKLWDFYHSGGVKLNIWNTVKAQAYFNTRFDDVLTGTFYAGNRRVNKITARVYDKQSETFERTKCDIGSRIRYELTVKTDQVNLRDVSDPTAVFWHYMSPALLKAPSDAPPWSPGNPFVWEGEKIPALSVEDRLYKVVYGVGDLNAAMAICGDSAAMFDLLLKLVRLRVLQRASKLPGWSPSYGT